MGVTLPQRCIKVIWVLGLFYGLSDSTESSASHQTSQLSAYEVTVPRRIGKQRRDLDGVTSGTVSYVIHAQGKDHKVVLEKNELLLPDDFTVYSYGKDGALVTERPRVQDHCHYQGYVEDMEGSSVALSICTGLRGVLHMENGSFGIEPLGNSTGFQHLLYRLEDVRTEPLTCGTGHTETDHTHDHNHDHEPRAVPVSHLLRRKRAVLHQTHYVELLLVVDNDRFNSMHRNQTAVREEMVELANYLDIMYVALNIRVVLVGLEIWSQGNPINTDGSAGEVLGRFVQWREQNLASRRRHDSAQLILKKNFGGTAGMAFVSTVCSRSHGGGINAYTNNNVQVFASIVAHELGHNLGMNHDRTDCVCTTGSCIMNSGATGSQNFSSCSADDFERLILHNGGSCLLNIPRPEEAYSAPYCGNKLVDVGEECDCGSDKECEKDPCCEAKTCKLKSGAQCADGVCCKHCQFLPGGTECKSSMDECDLPEFCNGSSPHCQGDVFKQDGHPCKEGQAYCYSGKCQHYDTQCQVIFGEKANAAPELCFKDVNSKGDRFGNCGYQGQGYKKCESRNAMCGKLQCENVQSKPFIIEPSIIKTPIAGTKCWGVDFRLGTDVSDPGMVNEGTKCAENKVCLNYQCVDVEVLKYDCNVQEKCHGHGVCNSNKNCHCEDGWAPPNCEAKGYGGSIDSGPTWNDKDTSTRDGLLVFFLLVLPLLAAGLYVFFRRNELRRRFCRKKRSQGYEANSRSPAPSGQGAPQRGNANNIVKDGVVQTNRSASAPAYATKPPPPARPRPPAATQLVPQRPAPPPPYST
ncbi:disintegrin and metalloproteinase domain-containing protein 9 isoform X3 [Conger conger]|uniref:disintegrin and metalloproteinase domain-containing protein 9 isoform X3 n=1 Tax=Conger conger TaxID=82655 RepID=UPI002A5A3B44|nr:disintegrin and metalloproteinase domain-containing protein 9 isoform X3 [Conger conger]